MLEFDPYYPPAALVEVNFYLPPEATGTGYDPLTLDRMGTAPGSSQATDQGPWLRFQRRYSADDSGVMESIRSYAASAGDTERGFDPVDRIVRISDRFMDFVLYETLKECFSRIDTKEEESDGFLGKLLDGRP